MHSLLPSPFIGAGVLR